MVVLWLNTSIISDCAGSAASHANTKLPAAKYLQGMKSSTSKSPNQLSLSDSEREKK